MALTAPPNDSSAGNGTRSSKPLTVLVVDDQIEMRTLWTNILTERHADVRIVEAADGVEALQRANEACPDLVLLDLMMPHMSGAETAARLKYNPKTQRAAIIVITGLPLSRDEIKMLGGDGVVMKPFTSGELVAEVARVVRARHPTP